MTFSAPPRYSVVVVLAPLPVRTTSVRRTRGLLRAIDKARGVRAPGNGLDLVKRGVAQRAGGAPRAAFLRHVAVGIVGIGVTARLRDGMGAGTAGAIAVAPHPGLAGDIAQGIVAHALGTRPATCAWVNRFKVSYVKVSVSDLPAEFSRRSVRLPTRSHSQVNSCSVRRKAS